VVLAASDNPPWAGWKGTGRARHSLGDLALHWATGNVQKSKGRGSTFMRFLRQDHEQLALPCCNPDRRARPTQLHAMAGASDHAPQVRAVSYAQG
jgi:hypothetical protein